MLGGRFVTMSNASLSSRRSEPVSESENASSAEAEEALSCLGRDSGESAGKSSGAQYKKEQFSEII